MLFVPILLLFTIIPGSYNKMFKLFGKVDSSPIPSTFSPIDNQDCIESCQSDPDCILAFMTSLGYCKLYTYSTTLTLTVEELFGDEGFYVAFKVDLEMDSCPVTYNSVSFHVTIGSETYSWTRTPTGWVITNCPEPWKVFERVGSVKICMRFFRTSDHATTREQAVETCESQGVQLTGVTEEEVEYWKTALDIGNNRETAWIDGVRNSNCWVTSAECYKRAKEELCQNFTYLDGYTLNGPPPIISECVRSIYPSPHCQAIVGGMGKLYISCAANYGSGAMCGFRMQ